MSSQPCYCINPHCKQADHPNNNDPNTRFCQICGSELLLNGQFRVSRLLSQNTGFGYIYEAFKGFSASILKVLKPEWNNQPKAIDLFKREYEVLAELRNQGVTGIPKVESFFEYQTREGLILYCLVMEKVEGIDLEQWVNNNGKINQNQALKWLRDIVLILDKIHAQNYFHRDLKPANIMMRNNGELVLIDFGTAREETQTYFQSLQGQRVTGIVSAGYTPEEQKNGQAVIQSDFFALGRTFVHLLTGNYPLDMYDGYYNVLKWREQTENMSILLLDFIDNLMEISAINRPVNTDKILQRLNEIEKEINQVQETKKLPAIINKLSPSKEKNKDIFFLFLLNISLSFGIFYIFGLNKLENKYISWSILPILYFPVNYSVKLFLQPNSKYYYIHGLKHSKLQEYDQAITDYTQAITLNPLNVEAYYNRGYAYYQLKEYDQAITDYTQAIALNHLNAKAYYNRGDTYFELKEYKKAITDYNQVLNLNPWDANAYHIRGLSYFYLKEYKKAIIDYNQAISIDSNYAQAYYNCGFAYKKLGNTKNALSDFRQSAIFFQQQGNIELYNKAMNKIRELGG